MENDIIRRLKTKFNSKKILVVGLGLQGGGIGLVNFFAKLGAEVRATDLKTKDQLKTALTKINDKRVKFTLGRHDEADFLGADYIFKGPSVRWNLPQIVSAQKKGVEIDMEASFFTAYCPAKIIGITGTRGKTTTTMMIYNILKNTGVKTYLGGNIPQVSTISLLEKVTKDDWVILELSSWQLSGFYKRKISPHIAVLTNLYPDHLNYYNSMDEYYFDKRAIFLFQKNIDYLVANSGLKDRIQKDKPKSQIIYFSAADFPRRLSNLKGVHNLENAAAAIKIAQLLHLGIQEAIDIICNFKTLPYRQEIIGQKNNVIFINDTTATTPTATIKAIKAFSDKPIILLLGNSDKNLPFGELIDLLAQPRRIVLLKGSFTDKILPFLKKKYPEKITQIYDDLLLATKEAYKLALQLKTESYVLLSPAGASFAMFDNEFHRGDEFNKIVHQILNNDQSV